MRAPVAPVVLPMRSRREDTVRRAVSSETAEAEVVVAVLSERYLHSTYGKLEWQAALRADPDGTGNPVTLAQSI